jgi:hypothetical protein
MENGKLVDVLIEEDELLDSLSVWADGDSVLQTLKNMSGIAIARKDDLHKNCYIIWLDPRYDRKWMIKEIVARLKIGE